LQAVSQQLSDALRESARLMRELPERSDQTRKDDAVVRARASELRTRASEMRAHLQKRHFVEPDDSLNSTPCSDRLAGLIHDLMSPLIGADKRLNHLLDKVGDKLASEDADCCRF